MKAVRFHKTGGPEVLVYEDVPDPKPGPGEVLIRVEAVGLNYADTMRRSGAPYPEPSPTPFMLGGEVAGTIAVLGEGVDKPAVGTPVFALAAGGYAQFVTVPAARATPIPPGLNAVQATALFVQGLTAALSLKEAGRLGQNESVLVEAAAGGVGSFAIQLAKLFGAGTVIAAASTPEKRELALGLGADVAVDYTDPTWPQRVREATGGRGVDLVLEMTGGQVLTGALDSLAHFGRMVVYGDASGQPVMVDPQRLVFTSQSIIGFYIAPYFARPDLIRITLTEIIGHVLSGRLKLQVGTVLPLAQAAEAHRLLEGRGTTGKVVLKPWDEV